MVVIREFLGPTTVPGKSNMSLQQADWHDTLKALHETVHIWSAGLSSVDYLRFLSLQLKMPWFHRNCKFMVDKSEGSESEVKASCKLYSTEYTSNGHIYKLVGLGAVYTQLKWRNQGCASELINEVIDLCEEQDLDGVVLYSEIDPDFYADFGFEEVGSVDFTIELSQSEQEIVDANSVESSVKSLESLDVASALGATPLTRADIPFLSRHYARWLRNQPFGMQRTDDYWQYKIFKETFLHDHSKSWPALSLIKIDQGYSCRGYAIVEINGANLRVLEIVGSEPARKIIWANLLTQILKGRVKRMRGWEAVIRDLSPTFRIGSLGLEPGALESFESLELFCSPREWGQGMILCLNPELRQWLGANPCPMLELDHL